VEAFTEGRRIAAARMGGCSVVYFLKIFVGRPDVNTQS
jgi:hypothetical protein